MAYQDSAEIQEIIEKTQKLLLKDCLSFDTHEESRENVKSNQSKRRKAVKSSLEEEKNSSEDVNAVQQPKLKKKVKINTIEGLITKMQNKGKQIQQQIRKLAEHEIRKQMLLQNGCYS